MHGLSRHVAAWTVSLAVALSAATTAMAQTIHYVDADAPGANDGTSWEDAFRDLQDALDAAEDNNGDEIRVAEGIYKPDRGTGDRLAGFRPEGVLAIRGGYAGYGEADPDERDFDRHQTVLSGDLGDNDGPDFANRLDNSVHVVVIAGADTTIVLDGLTITAGEADELGGMQGGGLHVSFSTVEIRDCLFASNQTSGQSSVGGGLYNVLGTIEIVRCTFLSNRSGNEGGGVYQNVGTLNIKESVFLGNSAALHGGGIRSNEGIVHLQDCTITENSTEFGAGLSSVGSDLFVDGCRFKDNIAKSSGGAIAVLHSTLSLARTEMTGNIAHVGGALVATGVALSIDRCVLSENVAFSNDLSATGGAISLIGYTEGEIHNTLFAKNLSEGFGGAIATNIRKPVRLVNCSLVENQAGESGDAIMHFSPITQMAIESSIIWDNGPRSLAPNEDRFLISYSAVPSSSLGEGNTLEDPLLDSGYAPTAGSPAINAGDPELRFEFGDRDLTGHPRVLCGRVDMGAYEFGIGDFSCDREVDLDDYATWLDCMTGPEGGPYERKCEAFDFDADGDVDVRDFAGMQGVLGRSG